MVSRKTVGKVYYRAWKTNIASKPNLRTYVNIKQEYDFENYVNDN